MSNLRLFLKSGHWPTLLSSFLYFDLSFMAWMLVGALANHISSEFGLSAGEKGCMVALPLLGGSLLRLALGALADRIGAKRTAQAGLGLTLLPLLYGWLGADSLAEVYLVGLLLGVAGASFAVALPLASRWYPAEQQGLALGIAGAGNSGTVLATLFAPRLAEAWGWQAVFGLAALPILACLAVLTLLAREAPGGPGPRQRRDYRALLAHPEALRLGFIYALTFGGFVGLASFLPVFFHDQYAASRVSAGDFATLCVIAGSFLRPVGGWLADRFGGLRVLPAILGGATLGLGMLALLPFLELAVLTLFCVMALLGAGNGAVFQLVARHFGSRMGAATGLIGAVGGLGGFCLPIGLGLAQGASGSYGSGLAGLAAMMAGGALLLLAQARARAERPALKGEA
ncbi:MAG: MFS transporter [Planctomycetota bacterium]|nr:MFS transporter [Planctomycetota bacterium]